MFIYNLALYLIFFSLFQFISFNFKTLYSLQSMGNTFINKVVTISILSMAGVPPFIGFFSKIFIFILLVDANFFILFSFFFILLFTGLYFYIQNIRLLNTSNPSSLPQQHTVNLKVNPTYYTTSLFIGFFLTFGFVYLEDVILFFYWILL